MLKIVSSLNGFSVRQSVTALGIQLQLELKNILFFNFFYYFSKKKFKNKIDFWKKNDFLVDFFFGHIPCKTTYGRRPTKKIFFKKKI